MRKERVKRLTPRRVLKLLCQMEREAGMQIQKGNGRIWAMGEARDAMYEFLDGLLSGVR